MRFAVAVLFLALNLYVYAWLGTAETIPERRAFAEFPTTIGEWHCAGRDVMDDATLENLGVTDYLLCNFVRDTPPALVNVYVGYHETQIRREGGGAGENSIHPPKHCLPGSGWDIIEADQISVDLPGLPARPALINRFTIAKGEARRVVYYWYQSRGRVIADDWKKIAHLFTDRASSGRTDGSLVRFTVPVMPNSSESADAVFEEFAPLVVQQLPGYVPE